MTWDIYICIITVAYLSQGENINKSILIQINLKKDKTQLNAVEIMLKKLNNNRSNKKKIAKVPRLALLWGTIQIPVTVITPIRKITVILMKLN